jgi:hypothetical protein
MDDIVVWGILYWRSKPGFRATVKLANREVVWLRCGLWRTRKICWSTYNLGPSPPAIALKHLISLPFTRLFLTLKLKDKLRELVQLCFIKKNGQRRYKYLVLGRDRSYFVKHHSDSTKKFSETDIFNMLEFLIDNIFAMFGLTCFSIDSRHTYGYQLCASSRRLVPLFVWDRLHTGASQEKAKRS